MPWAPKEAGKFSKEVGGASSQRKRQWSHVANSMLEKTGDEGKAIAAANSVAGSAKSPAGVSQAAIGRKLQRRNKK